MNITNLENMNVIVLKRKQKKLGCVRHIIILGLMLFAGAVHGQNQNIDDEVRRSMTRAKAAYEIGSFQDALTEYQKVSKLVPDFFDIYKAIGDTYEKMGGEDNLKNAIESYKRYLSLSPNAADKVTIQDKIDRLGYLFEKQAEKNFILDDLKGLWISNLVNISDKKQRDTYFSQMVKEKKLSPKEADALKTEGLLLDTTYRVNTESTPLMFFRMTEMGKTGKYRVEILKESAFYKESIIQKVVSIVPDKNNTIRFTFADEAKYIPSQAKWNALRDIGAIVGGAIGGVGGDITNMVANSAANFGQEGDLPSNTQTAYNFELQYNDGKLTGYCNVVQGYSSAKATKETKNDFYEIEFWKDNEYLDKLQLLKDKEKNKKEQENRDKKAKKLVSFGVLAGFSNSSISYNGKQTPVINNDDETTTLGFRAGIFLEFRLSNLISIQPGVTIGPSRTLVHYSGQGTITTDNWYVASDGHYYNNPEYKDFDYDEYGYTNATMIEIPINMLFKYNYNKSRLYGGIGIVIDKTMENSIAYTTIYQSDPSEGIVASGDGINFTNIGFNLKAGYSYRAFFIEFGYNAGMTDISFSNDVTGKISSFYGSLGLRF